MEKTPIRGPRPLYGQILRIVNMSLVWIYFLLGIWFLIDGTSLFEVPKIQQQIAGGLIVVYSIYRGLILDRRYFSGKEGNH